MSAADKPYVFASGDAWGAEQPEPTPRDLQPRQWKHALGARAHRAKTDPLWRTRDAASKAALIALDLKESRRS